MRVLLPLRQSAHWRQLVRVLRRERGREGGRLLGRGPGVQVALCRRDSFVTHRGLDGHRVDPRSDEEGAERVPEIVPTQGPETDSVTRAVVTTAERGAI